MAAPLIAVVLAADILSMWTALGTERLLRNAQVEVALDEVATMHAAMAEAAIAVEGGYASALPAPLQRPAGPASAEAAAAFAAHDVLASLLPAERAFLDAVLDRSLASLRDPAAREAGGTIGKRAAAAVLRLRGDARFHLPDRWVPAPPAPGAYVADGVPVGTRFAEAKPWSMEGAAQFRPGPPPALDSAAFVRDLAEVKARGGKDSSRTAAETQTALLWNDVTAPFAQILGTLSAAPGRTVAQNARLWALASTAATDATIAVYDAKYAYRFWRPIAALRAAGDDSWQPFLPTPRHPEYPCGHCIVAATLAAVLAAEFGEAPKGGLHVAGPGFTRGYQTFQQLADEAGEARVLGGMHFRNSTQVAAQMGRKLAARALDRMWQKLTPRPATAARR